MDHLWRHTKRQTVGNRATLSIEESTLHACQYILTWTRATSSQSGGSLGKLLADDIGSMSKNE